MMGGGGERGGQRELNIANPKKYNSLKFYTQKYNWHQNFHPQKNTRLQYLNILFNQADLKTLKNTWQIFELIEPNRTKWNTIEMVLPLPQLSLDIWTV